MLYWIEYLDIGVVGTNSPNLPLGLNDGHRGGHRFHPHFFAGIAVQGGVALHIEQPLTQHQALTMLQGAMSMDQCVDPRFTHPLHPSAGERAFMVTVFGAHDIGEWTIVEVERVTKQQFLKFFIEMLPSFIIQYIGHLIIDTGMHKQE